MLWRSRDERFPAMGRCLEWDLSRLLLHRQVNAIENISNKSILFITEDQLSYRQLSRLWPASTTNPGNNFCVREDPRPRLHLCGRESPRGARDADADGLGPPRHHGGACRAPPSLPLPALRQPPEVGGRAHETDHLTRQVRAGALGLHLHGHLVQAAEVHQHPQRQAHLVLVGSKITSIDQQCKRLHLFRPIARFLGTGVGVISVFVQDLLAVGRFGAKAARV